MIQRVLLDLDDTLNSLTLHILNSVFRIAVGPYEYERFPAHLGYDILGAYEYLKPEGWHSYDVQSFWEAVPRWAWATAPKSPQFDFLIEQAVSLVGRDNVCILTTPTKDPDCLAGKLEWIHDNLPPWLHRQFLVGPRKHFCARQDTLLIDDSDEQVNNFRAHGGYAILVPRPWNTNHLHDTDEYLTECFRLLEGKWRIAA